MFNPSEKLTICTILGITPSLLDAQITDLGTSLTSDVETAVRAEITRWTSGIGVKNTRLYPKESNKGVETDPLADKADVRRNIAVLLEIFGYTSTARMGTFEVGL